MAFAAWPSWSVVALGAGGVLLVATLLAGRPRAGLDAGTLELLRGRLAAMAFPLIVTLLAVASTAQALFQAPPLARATAFDGVRTTPARRPGKPVPDALVDGLDDAERAAEVGPTLVEQAYVAAQREQLGLAGQPAAITMASADRLEAMIPGLAGNDAVIAASPLPMVVAAVAAARAREQQAAATGGGTSAAAASLFTDLSATSATTATAATGATTPAPTVMPDSRIAPLPLLAPALIRPGPLPEQAAAAVPEPASWLTMTVGFGACGIALRRRRRPVAREA